MRSMWLVYDTLRAQRNRWMINHYIATAPRHGLQCTLVLADGPLPDAVPELALFRCVAPALRAQLEQRGVVCHNGTELAAIANDKWATYQYFKERGCAVMETQLAAGHTLVPPFVVKPRDGHGGAGVELVREPVQQSLRGADENLIVQALADTPGVDLRVYLLGGSVQAAMLRRSNTSFKSNFSLGGSAQVYPLNDDALAAIAQLVQVAPILSQGLCGVDFIRHQGRWVLNEIEDVVGMRMLYTQTQLDIVDKHLAYLAQA
ncbi:ATP-grasp domain-containing protein [Corynebacterium cystitidis]|uniref:Gamma-F420-2:alpha-L-glutamate ligase n=1 Tax=Corynebacterium cystitidis DSM 20524 TaxID=1121357 RepID=A0A1H9ST76_9CORY|nr:ATP-grasp domain-containing protein [Corynebacterium cystitidis]WJY83155.1 Alpha-aminoadipate--LysW ligase LysX [Corynebacterium cystitidis DSM 20524]SER87603.1 gamma-F420-2:alpha-L-glutamate ligase [Corynebacterium cystitidis DSM 20524]SNV66870.1 Alpha-aminoadipate--lysW ligase lysX [Corynebacterium cystitidis]